MIQNALLRILKDREFKVELINELKDIILEDEVKDATIELLKRVTLDEITSEGIGHLINGAMTDTMDNEVFVRKTSQFVRSLVNHSMLGMDRTTTEYNIEENTALETDKIRYYSEVLKEYHKRYKRDLRSNSDTLPEIFEKVDKDTLNKKDFVSRIKGYQLDAFSGEVYDVTEYGLSEKLDELENDRMIKRIRRDNDKESELYYNDLRKDIGGYSSDILNENMKKKDYAEKLKSKNRTNLFHGFNKKKKEYFGEVDMSLRNFVKDVEPEKEGEFYKGIYKPKIKKVGI